MERWDDIGESPTRDGWVFSVALNNGRRSWQRSERERDVLEQLPHSERESLQTQDVDLWRAVDSLPTKMRTVILLRYVSGLSQAETAVAVGNKPGTVAATLNQGRARLRSELGEDNFDR